MSPTHPSKTNGGPRGRTPAVIILLVAVFAATLAATASVADAQPGRDRVVDRVTDERPVRDAPNDRVERLRLDCHRDIVGDRRGVFCRWSASSADSVRGYQLYRSVNGSARQLVVTVPVGDRLHAFDTDIRPGDHLVYGVVARTRTGRVIGFGGPVRVAIPG